METRNLLLIDDDRVFRERMALALRDRGLEVREASDGSSGLGIAQSWRPARVVVDLRMPGDSGLEVVRQLRAFGPDMVVVVLTGYGSIATAKEALRLGAHDYLTKPVDADQLLAALNSVDGEEAEAPLEPGQVPSLARMEWEHIHRVLSDCGGNVSQAARVLGIHRRSLQRKLAKFPPPEAVS
ncbi:MAG: response regulator [Phycisphaerae bacterium]|nr:response regulator [Phycisphaerae bacterium]